MSDGRNPHVLVFAEKNGFVKWLQEVSRAFGVHAVALGGSPSHLSTEYLVAQLLQKVKSLDSLILFGVTDYDPAGADIARSFREQLEHQGVKVAGLHSVIEPSVFLPQELTDFSFPVPHRYPTKVQRWLKESGGLNGKAFGIEADSLPKPRLQLRLGEQLKPYLVG